MDFEDYICNLAARIIVPLLVAIVAGRAGAAEPLVAVTVFELSDGRSIDSISFSVMSTNAGERSYVIRSCDGEWTRIQERELAKRSVKHVKLSALPEDAQQSFARSREAAERQRQAPEPAVEAPALPVATRKRQLEAKLSELTSERAALSAELNQQQILSAGAQATYEASLAVLRSGGGVYASGYLERLRRQATDSARQTAALKLACNELREALSAKQEEIRKVQGDLEAVEAELAALRSGRPAVAAPEARADALVTPALVNPKAVKADLDAPAKHQPVIDE